MFGKLSVLIAALVLLSSCGATLRGTPRVIDSTGVVQQSEADDVPRPSEQNLQFRGQFLAAAQAARDAPADRVAVQRMMQSGLILIQLNCDDFFDGAAILQRDARVARDMVAPIFSILAGIVSIRDIGQNRSDELLQIFSLTSSGALAGISLVDTHFLFGAENIHEVEELTFESLGAGEELIAAEQTPDYWAAVRQLIRQQRICTPRGILDRTRQAIAAGDVRPDIGGPRVGDDPALAALGDALGLVSSATSAQAVGAWALYRTGLRTIPANVVAQLSQVGLSDLVKTEGNVSSLSDIGLQKESAVLAALGAFSAENKNRLESAARQVITPPLPEPGSPVVARNQPVDVDLTTGPRRRGRLVVE